MRHILIGGAQEAAPDRDPEVEVEALLGQLLEISVRLSGALRVEDPPADANHCSELVAEILRFRKYRNKAFGDDLFGEPAWDILLELYTAARTGRRLSVSGACYVSGVPQSTALRWITRLERDGHIVRINDPFDGRRSWLALSEESERKMDDLLSRMAA